MNGKVLLITADPLSLDDSIDQSIDPAVAAVAADDIDSVEALLPNMLQLVDLSIVFVVMTANVTTH